MTSCIKLKRSRNRLEQAPRRLCWIKCNVPALLPAVKGAVDANRSSNHFVLSGSANLLLMHPVSESLAGREVYFGFHAITIGEFNHRPAATILEDLQASCRAKEKYPQALTVSRLCCCADADYLGLCLKQHRKALSGGVIYRGQEIRRLDERILVLTVSVVLGL